jgi:anti-anti-sigma factor
MHQIDLMHLAELPTHGLSEVLQVSCGGRLPGLRHGWTVTDNRFSMQGEVDVDAVSAWEERLRVWLAAGEPPVIDLKEVTFIDSSGLNMRVRVSENVEPLSLVGLQPTLERLFAGVGDVFTFERDDASG